MKMNKAQKYIKEHSEYEIHVVEKAFGNGKQLIQFFYKAQAQVNQGFLAYVDNQRWKYERHEIMDEVEKWMVENIGAFDHDDFYEEYTDFFFMGYTNLTYNEYFEEYFEEWEKGQFPKVDLEFGGVSFFDEV
jgi:hypothetical protein